MTGEIPDAIQVTPQSAEEREFLDEVVTAFNGGLKREVRPNYSDPFEKEQVKKALDKFMATVDLPEVQKFLNSG